MKNTFLKLCSVSILALMAFPVMANDKILSPTGKWSVEGSGQGECIVSNKFEEGVGFKLVSKQTQLKELRFIIEAESFQMGTSYDVSFNVPPAQIIQTKGVALSQSELLVEVAEQGAITQILQKGFVAYLGVNGLQYGLSLGGMSDVLRKLQTCRDSDLNAARQVYDFKQPAVSAPVETNNSVPSSTVAAASALKINPFPLDPAKAVAKEDESEIVVKQETEAPIETIETSVDESILSETQPQQSAVEEEKTAEIEPSIELPKPTPGVESPVRADLTRPPVLDMPLPPVDEVAATPPQDELSGTESRIVEAPDGVIVNEGAQIYVADPSITKVAAKEDYMEEEQWSNSPAPQRPERTQLSQTSEMAEVAPVIIPRVPEAELPTRFDLMNRGHAEGKPSNIPQEPPRQVREVSNEELEMQLKAAENEILVAESATVAPQIDTAAIIEPVVPSYPARVPPKTKRREQVKTETAPAAPQNTEVTNAEQVFEKPAVTLYEQMPSETKWKAPAGADLRTVIANWAITENVELIWDTQDQFNVLTQVQMNDRFESAVANLLNQYATISSGKIKPVGELYIDPDTDKKILIIQSVQS